MKTKVYKIIAAVLIAAHAGSAHAMFTRFSQAAVRPGLSAFGTQPAPATYNYTFMRGLQNNPTLLARTLAAQQSSECPKDKNDQSSDENNSRSEYKSWWQRWRSKLFGRYSGTALGLSIFGLWSDDDICQTPEDFKNLDKLIRMKQYLNKGGKENIFNVFIKKFKNLRDCPEAVERILEFFVQTFESLVSRNLTRTYKLRRFAVKHYPILEKNAHGKKLLEKLSKVPEAHGILHIEGIIQNFDSYKDNPAELNRIINIFLAEFDAILDHEEYTNSLDFLVIENISIIQAHACGQQLIDKLAAKNSLFYTKLALCRRMAQTTTQTAQHFNALKSKNIAKIQQLFPNDPAGAKAFADITDTILALEKSEQAKGNYTFVHAYNWNIHFYQDLDAQLRSIILARPKQPISLRFFKHPNAKKSDTYAESRKELISKGPTQYYAYENNKQKYMIFLNYALFASRAHWSNTLKFMHQNFSEQNPEKKSRLTVNKIFKRLNIETYATKYKREIEELQKLHNEASKFGAGILFSFTPEMLKESVYVCNSGGTKRTATIDDVKTEDVATILNTLRTAPEKIQQLDDLEFVFVVTKDCGLNPRVIESGAVKTIPFNAADPEKLALYEQKRDELMAKIKTDIKTERAKWNKQKKLAHERTLKQMNQWYAKYNCLNDCKQSRVQEN